MLEDRISYGGATFSLGAKEERTRLKLRKHILVLDKGNTCDIANGVPQRAQ